MPIMTVTTLCGKSHAEKSRLASELTDCVHTFMNRPREIIRVIFHEIPAESYAVAGEFLDPSSGDPDRRDDTILRISLMAGRTRQQKEEIIQHLAAVLRNNPSFSSAEIRIIIEETPEGNFYRSNKQRTMGD